MKKTLVFILALSLNAFAHDEGHGPKIMDASKQGGIVAPVVLAKDASLGTKAQMQNKAEIVRTQDGTVRVYFYDKTMKPLVSGLGMKAQGNLISGKKRKNQRAEV